MARTTTFGAMTVFAVMLAAGMVAGISGCAGSKAARGKEEDPEARAIADLRRSVDAADPTRESEEWPQERKRAVYEEGGGGQRSALDAAFDELDKKGDDLEAAVNAVAPVPPRVERAGPALDPAKPLAEPEPEVALAPAGPPEPVATESAEERLARQVAEVRKTVRELRSGGESASAEAVELLALHLLRADGSAPELEALREKLSVSQAKTLGVLEGLLSEVRAGDGSGTALDARRLARLLDEYGEKLADTRPLRIVSSALCTSVQSYGSYSKFPSYTFLQGRAQPVIVYVALENFSQRNAGDDPTSPDSALATAAFNPPSSKELEKKAADKREVAERKEPVKPAATRDVVVELTERIAIHNDSDDLIVWQSPEASVRDVSRDRRKDYYLVQRLDLPVRLTLGKYNVKVTVRDVATGSTDEAIIPIEIVADPALVSAR